MTSQRLLTQEARILLDAADLIETHGLCKDALHEGGRYCAMGAIARAAEIPLCDAYIYPITQTRAAVKLLRQICSSSIADWNDAPERTAEDVVAALRAAAIAP
jgi:hypothetical protein